MGPPHRVSTLSIKSLWRWREHSLKHLKSPPPPLLHAWVRKSPGSTGNPRWIGRMIIFFYRIQIINKTKRLRRDRGQIVNVVECACAGAATRRGHSSTTPEGAEVLRTSAHRPEISIVGLTDLQVASFRSHECSRYGVI